MEYVERSLPTAEQALNGMKMAKELFITKDGYFYNFASEKYVEKMKKYEEYIAKEEVESWCKCIKGTIHLANEKDDDFLLITLLSYEKAGIVMKELCEKQTEYKRRINKIYLNDTMVAYLVLKYSLHAVEFAEDFIDKYTLTSIDVLKQQYDKAKLREKEANI